MTADIVEQLRFGSKVALAMHLGGHRQPETWEVMVDAATEIVRLREEVSLWRERCESLLRDMHESEQSFDRAMRSESL